MAEQERRSIVKSKPAQSTVSHLVGMASSRQAEIADEAAGRDGRGRAGNAGQIGKDRQGTTKATYALPIARQELVRQIAEEESVSQTDIIEAAIVLLANARKAGRIDFEDIRVPAKSLRVLWHLEVEDDFFLA